MKRLALLATLILAGTIACAAMPRDCGAVPPFAVKCKWGVA